MKVHKIPITDIDMLIPWEREVYTTLLQAYIEEKNKKMNQARG